MMMLGGDAELELVDFLDPLSEIFLSLSTQVSHLLAKVLKSPAKNSLFV
jgi:hypothetical protein